MILAFLRIFHYRHLFTLLINLSMNRPYQLCLFKVEFTSDSLILKVFLYFWNLYFFRVFPSCGIPKRAVNLLKFFKKASAVTSLTTSKCIARDTAKLYISSLHYFVFVFHIQGSYIGSPHLYIRERLILLILNTGNVRRLGGL